MSQGLLPRRLALALVRVGRRFPRAVLLAALGAWLVAGLAATRLDVETDILSLVPAENPVVRDFTTTIELFGSVDTLLVVVRLEQGNDLEPALEFTDRLARSLREWQLIDWVEYQVESSAETAFPLLGHATLLLGPDQIRDLLERLSEDALADQMARVHSQLLAPQSMFTKDFVRVDPMGFLAQILDNVRLGGVGISVDAETGCLMDPERRMLLMVAKPTGPAQDLAFDRELTRGLRERLAQVEEAWHGDGWDGDPPRVEFTGGHVIALADSDLITTDAIVGVVSSLVGVMVLFVLAFRRFSAIVFAIVPLVTGLALTIVFVSLALGRLNSLTAASGGLLIGLGIDFIIVLYGRYVEERQLGREHDAAIDSIGRFTGVGVVLGAVTTAATFLAFLATEFRGLSELGLLTGIGILILMAAVFLLLPAMLTLVDGRWSSDRSLALRSFGSDKLCRLCLRHPGWTLVVGLAVTLLMAIAASGLGFDDDMRNLRSSANPGSILRDEVMAAFGLRFSPMTVRIDGPDEAHALATARRMLPELEKLVDGITLASIDTIADVVPPIEMQREVISILAGGAPGPSEVRARMESALRAAGLNPVAFDEGIEHLTSALSVREPLALSELRSTTLARVVDRYVVRHEDGVSTAIYCYPPAGQWRRQAPLALVDLVTRYPNAVVTGPNVVSAELRRIVWGDAARAAALGLVLVFCLLWADLGSPLRSSLALLPLSLGMVWMLGGMALFGLRINFMNIFVATMVIGIGVDYGVHLLHRWYESGGRPEALQGTAKAIAVAALTTMVGFGSLVLSHFPGLRSVGSAAIFGALATAVASITVLPAVLSKLGMDRRHIELGEGDGSVGPDG
jgi:predicted RND superfamily exporter protein